MHLAAKSNNSKVLEILLKAGASYKANDGRGYFAVCSFDLGKSSSYYYSY